MEKATIVEQLEQVRRRIEKTEVDLEGAQVRGDRELELRYSRILELLLEDKKTLTNALTSSGKYYFL